jgi:hypothetical protein
MTRTFGGGKRRAGICRGIASAMRARDNVATKNMRATQCVQREYSWLLAALAELHLAHSRQRHAPLLSITRRRRVTATGVGTVGRGMDAHPVTRYRAETAHPIKDQLAAVGVAMAAARPATQSKAVFVSRTGVLLVPGYYYR